MPHNDEYASAASVYNFVTAPFLKRIRQAMARQVQALQPASILDVCCGTGIFAHSLRQQGISAHCLDFSHAMLVQGSTDSTPTVRADASCMPYPDATFQAATITLALHEMEPKLRTRVLTEIKRVLVPGGTLFILDYNAPVMPPQHLAHCGIWVFEMLAGARHYAMYKQFILAGGTQGMLEAHGLSYQEVDRFYMGSISLFLVGMT